MEEQLILLTLFGKSFSPYAVFTAVGALLGMVVFVICGRKEKPLAVVLTVALAVPLCLLGARAFYVVCRLGLFAEVGFGNFFRATEPDYNIWGSVNGAAFWGAVGGGALAALLAGRIAGSRVSGLLDAMAPGAALALVCSRLGEYSIGEGIGPDVSVPGLCFFPMAVVNEWGEWKYAVFLLEALAALVIFLVLLSGRISRRGGDKARAFLILYSSSQILFEALRRDNFLRWLFVRVSQVTAAVVLLGLFIFAVLRWTRRPEGKRMPLKHLIAYAVGFLLLAGAVVALEFAVDKSPTLSVAMAYLLEACCAVGFGVITWQVVMKN